MGSTRSIGPNSADVTLTRAETEVLETILGLIEDNRDRYDPDAPWLDDIDRLWARLHLSLERPVPFRPTAREVEVIRDVLTEGTPWEDLFADDENQRNVFARVQTKMW